MEHEGSLPFSQDPTFHIYTWRAENKNLVCLFLSSMCISWLSLLQLHMHV